MHPEFQKLAMRDPASLIQTFWAKIKSFNSGGLRIAGLVRQSVLKSRRNIGVIDMERRNFVVASASSFARARRGLLINDYNGR